jgi:uridine phosphorylase
MEKLPFSATDLVLNNNGSVYHLNLKNEHIADTVLLVGDQNRVKQISRYFDATEYHTENREFITETGLYKGKRITAISTGIGTDNVDIVMNELFAATHISPETRCLNTEPRKLKIIRIGTSGALQPEITLGSFVVSEYGLGLDGLLHYYTVDFDKIETELSDAFSKQTDWPEKLAQPYFCGGSSNLHAKIAHDMQTGITASGTGFYGPQGRNLTSKNILDVQGKLASFRYSSLKVNNFDMETSALYGLGKVFGFECLTVNVIIANRATKDYIDEYHIAVNNLIKTVLERI